MATVSGGEAGALGSSRPLGLLAWYDATLKRSPLRTKCVSSGVASGIGDALAQALSPSMGSFDVGRCAAFTLVGAAYFGPILHAWYQTLAAVEARWRAKGFGKGACVGIQLLLNQTLGAFLVNAGFFYAMGLAERVVTLSAPTVETFAAATTALRAQYWTVMKANWVVWPLPSLVNLALVPLEYRVLWTNAVAVVWKCALSTITKSAT